MSFKGSGPNRQTPASHRGVLDAQRLREIVEGGATITHCNPFFICPLDTAAPIGPTTLFYKFAEHDPFHWEHFLDFDEVDDDGYQLNFFLRGAIAATLGPAEEPEHIQHLKAWREAGNSPGDHDAHIALLAKHHNREPEDIAQ